MSAAHIKLDIVLCMRRYQRIQLKTRWVMRTRSYCIISMMRPRQQAGQEAQFN